MPEEQKTKSELDYSHTWNYSLKAVLDLKKKKNNPPLVYFGSIEGGRGNEPFDKMARTVIILWVALLFVGGCDGFLFCSLYPMFCSLSCQNGYAKDSNGCALCKCATTSGEYCPFLYTHGKITHGHLKGGS